MRGSVDAIRILRRVGEQPNEEINLAEAALALASLSRAEADLEPYREHLRSLVKQVEAGGTAHSLDDRLCLLRRVLVVRNKYRGDDERDDEFRNANFMHVIDRRRGTGLMLGILYLHIAESVGWSMVGLNFPGRFLVRLSGDDGHTILDPFGSGKTCSAEELRKLAAPDNPGAIEKLPDYYTPLSKRDILLGIQENLKKRQLALDLTDAAVDTLQSMILVAPFRHEYWRELGFLQAQRGNLRSAISALEIVCNLADEAAQTEQAETMMQQLRRQLN